MEIPQELKNAFADTGRTAQDFNTTEMEIVNANDGSTWTANDGTMLTKNSHHSYTISHPTA